MYETLAVLAVFAFVYSVVAGRAERTPVNGPVVYLAFGILAGPFVLGLLQLRADDEIMQSLAELTLALVLFSDSASADLATLRRSEGTNGSAPANGRENGGPLALKEAQRRFEIHYVEELLAQTGGNVAAAARLACISRPNFHKKLKTLGVDAQRFKQAARRGRLRDL